jgi:NAD-dependent DNA ligase
MVADESGLLALASEYQLLFDGIKKSRENPNEFLHLLMPFLDLESCDKIMMNFWLSSMDIEITIKHLFAPSTLSRLGFSEEVIMQILYFLDTFKVKFVNIMYKYHKIPNSNFISDKLYKRTFFIEGLLYDKDRAKYEAIINKYCGRVVSSLAPYVTGVIYGIWIDRSVLAAARELSTYKDVAIYSEEEFNKLVNQANGGIT